MTNRDFAAIPLALSSITYNWWSRFIDNPASFILPTLGAVLIIVQIRYYWKMTRK